MSIFMVYLRFSINHLFVGSKPAYRCLKYNIRSYKKINFQNKKIKKFKVSENLGHDTSVNILITLC